MSQQITPVNGGKGQVQTAISVVRPQVLSDKAVELRKLEPQLTEWRVDGRPVYGRLPAASENYRIDFFEEKGEGYVFIPYGEGIFGPNSMEVVASDNKESIIIKPGTIIWEYGENPVDPAVINCRLVGLGSTRYLIGYQLYYDDAPFDALYQVEDFLLSGLNMSVEASTDGVIGWRYPAVNAFLFSGETMWKTSDNSFPSYAQPSESWISWKPEKTSAYSKIEARCPNSTLVQGSASLYFKINEEWSLVAETDVKSDSEGNYFEFLLDQPTFQTEYKIMWSSSNVAINRISVTGLVTLTSRPATPTTRSALVAYPENMVPDTFLNSDGEEIPLSICALAYVDTSEDFRVLKIDDVRKVIHKDYKPIAEWLTRPQDEDLIGMYEEVSDYSTVWMSPQKSLQFEYEELRESSVTPYTSSQYGE